MAILTCALVVAIGSCTHDGEPKTRIVLITLDTLRYDSFAGAGDRSSAMPALSARSEACLDFESFYAASPATQPTHATLFTALHPWQHGVSGNGQALGEEHVTLAELLRTAGFRTAAVVASFPLAARFGLDQGFDDYDDSFTQPLYDTHNWQGTEVPGDRSFYSLATDVTAKALDALDRHDKARRQFFWFHYFDPHDPYGDSLGGPTEAPLEVVRRIVREEGSREREIDRARQLYDADVTHVDRHLDRLFERLDRDAERIETHILLTADHGESFGEDDSMFHGRRLTAGQIHVPFLICSPRVAPGIRRDPAGSVDLPATVLSLANVSGTATAGRDLGRPARRRGRAFGMRNTFFRSARELRLDGRTYDLNEPLFYLVDEHGVLYRGNRLTVFEPSVSGDAPRLDDRKLRALFGSFEAELKPVVQAPDPEVEKALEALGYLP